MSNVIQHAKGHYYCPSCNAEWSAMLGDNEIPEHCPDCPPPRVEGTLIASLNDSQHKYAVETSTGVYTITDGEGLLRDSDIGKTVGIELTGTSVCKYLYTFLSIY